MSLFGPRFLKWNNCILIKKDTEFLWNCKRACVFSPRSATPLLKQWTFFLFTILLVTGTSDTVYEWMVWGLVVVTPRYSIRGDNCFPYDFYKSTDGLIRIVRTSVAFSLRILRRLSCLVQDLELKFMAWTWHPFHSYRAHPGIRAKWHVLKYNLSHLPGVSLEAWKLKILRFFLTPIHAFL